MTKQETVFELGMLKDARKKWSETAEERFGGENIELEESRDERVDMVKTGLCILLGRDQFGVREDIGEERLVRSIYRDFAALDVLQGTEMSKEIFMGFLKNNRDVLVDEENIDRVASVLYYFMDGEEEREKVVKEIYDIWNNTNGTDLIMASLVEKSGDLDEEERLGLVNDWKIIIINNINVLNDERSKDRLSFLGVAGLGVVENPEKRKELFKIAIKGKYWFEGCAKVKREELEEIFQDNKLLELAQRQAEDFKDVQDFDRNIMILGFPSDGWKEIVLENLLEITLGVMSRRNIYSLNLEYLIKFTSLIKGEEMNGVKLSAKNLLIISDIMHRKHYFILENQKVFEALAEKGQIDGNDVWENLVKNVQGDFGEKSVMQALNLLKIKHAMRIFAPEKLTENCQKKMDKLIKKLEKKKKGKAIQKLFGEIIGLVADEENQS